MTKIFSPHQSKDRITLFIKKYTCFFLDSTKSDHEKKLCIAYLKKYVPRAISKKLICLVCGCLKEKIPLKIQKDKLKSLCLHKKKYYGL
jgi:hypothetical protein